MPQRHTVITYSFDELNEESKENAIQKYRENGIDYEWYDCTIDDAKEIGKLMGIEISNIYFSGFSSQGDGACFEGHYSYQKGSVKAVKAYAPQDEELHKVAMDLQAVQRKNFYGLSATVKHRGHYHHELCTEIVVSDSHNDNGYGDATDEAEEGIKEALRDFMRWIYKRLEAEYDYINSDEYISGTLIANGYEFDEAGGLA